LRNWIASGGIACRGCSCRQHDTWNDGFLSVLPSGMFQLFLYIFHGIRCLLSLSFCLFENLRRPLNWTNLTNPRNIPRYYRLSVGTGTHCPHDSTQVAWTLQMDQEYKHQGRLDLSVPPTRSLTFHRSNSVIHKTVNSKKKMSTVKGTHDCRVSSSAPCVSWGSIRWRFLLPTRVFQLPPHYFHLWWLFLRVTPCQTTHNFLEFVQSSKNLQSYAIPGRTFVFAHSFFLDNTVFFPPSDQSSFKWIGKLHGCLRQQLWTKSLYRKRGHLEFREVHFWKTLMARCAWLHWMQGAVYRLLYRLSESLFRSQFYPRVCVCCVLRQRETVGIGRGWRCYYHWPTTLSRRSIRV
jgi:hypothetical protein